MHVHYTSQQCNTAAHSPEVSSRSPAGAGGTIPPDSLKLAPAGMLPMIQQCPERMRIDDRDTIRRDTTARARARARGEGRERRTGRLRRATSTRF